MNRPESIVVVVDFTPRSVAPVIQALDLAGRTGAALHFGHIVALSAPRIPAHGATTLQRDILEGLVADAARHWSELIADVAIDTAPQLDVQVDQPALALQRFVRTYHPDLVILGIPDEDFAQSDCCETLAVCLHETAVPLLLIRTSQIRPFRSILACIDPAHADSSVLELAGAMAGFFELPLTVLHVEAAPHAAANVKYDRPSAHCCAVVTDVHPVRSIIRYVQQESPDLVVLGQSGQFRLRHLLHGTTAQQLLSQTASAVLVAASRWALSSRGHWNSTSPAAPAEGSTADLFLAHSRETAR